MRRQNLEKLYEQIETSNLTDFLSQLENLTKVPAEIQGVKDLLECARNYIPRSTERDKNLMYQIFTYVKILPYIDYRYKFTYDYDLSEVILNVYGNGVLVLRAKRKNIIEYSLYDIEDFFKPVPEIVSSGHIKLTRYIQNAQYIRKILSFVSYGNYEG